ncbi:MAG: hypothetical protein EA421_03500 [Gemmatimonadales bacterium]|nr:MAG: hypothetical protein EA421_03500 [Gemmatimonadales bacterium]
MRAVPRRWALLFALFLAVPGGGAAQAPSELPEARASRSLFLSEVTFLGTSRPAVLVGGLHQLSVRPSRTVLDEDGIRVRQMPSTYLHLAASGGWSFERDPGGGAVARMGAGVVHRIQPTPISALGPVAGVSFGERSYSLALRTELLDNIGVEVGWVHRDRGGQNRLLLSVDALHCILQDLGLIQHCPGSPR